MSYQYIAGMFDGEGTLSIFRHHAPSFRRNIITIRRKILGVQKNNETLFM